MITLDEVANWPETRKARRFWGVLTSGNRKIADCRTVVITQRRRPAALGVEAAGDGAYVAALAVRQHPGPAAVADRRSDLQILRENAETEASTSGCT